MEIKYDNSLNYIDHFNNKVYWKSVIYFDTLCLYQYIYFNTNRNSAGKNCEKDDSEYTTVNHHNVWIVLE